MEKETVRTRVMLASGDQMPAKENERQPGNRAMRTERCEQGDAKKGRRTAPESMDAFCAVCVADAVGEGVELVAVGRERQVRSKREVGVRTLADAS
jgi:hypothetical protein